ncbi:hypothetical protein H7I77_13860 [Mycolicibacterium novocastrense]|uniref:Integral membrane protein n=1 Tax=Mycolicibacterium novocastrense TaxID=59813 RepID=A0AAW5SN02_MYCNV|nr:hypothetical protein [Mycolicibacterium novocastrense]MCV7024418.1 hypothetical protein [Mycolicibacterium novocastrense]GAT12923.1 uncharacterized protein RMCN_6056 [Mycolicibacterium novocastrense]
MVAEQVELSATAHAASRWPHLLARSVTATLVVVVIAQSALAGNFLGGRYDALMLHSVGARVTEVLALLQIVALVALRRAGGPKYLVPLAVSTLVVVLAQSATGLERLTGLHIPLGVMLILGITQLTLSVWRLPLPTTEDPQRSVIQR